MADQNGSDIQQSFAEMLAQHDGGSQKLQPGQKISGKIIAVAGDSVFLDIGAKEDGVMDAKELLDAEGKEIANIGDAVEGWITAISSQGVHISRSMSGVGLAALEDAKEAAMPVNGRVRDICKGGYHVEVLGKTAFCPASQMDLPPDGKPEEMVGRQTQFLISRLENHGRNIVVSRRALLDRERKENLDKLLASLNIGDVVEGEVTRLAPYGVFVELAPAVEGLVHLSELGWSRVDTPDELMAVKDKIRVKVLGVETDDKGRVKISLSRKQAEEDPWNSISDRFSAGDLVEGKVRRFAPFGAFVEIAPGVEGLIHVSEMSWTKRVNKPEDVLNLGDSIQVKIKDIDRNARRVSLSLKDAEGDPWSQVSEMFQPGGTVKGTVEKRTPHGIFVTLAPGITGLIPVSALKNAPAEAAKVNGGESLKVKIQRLDAPARRISLSFAQGEETEGIEDSSWKDHARKEDDARDLGIMAQALKKAFQKNKGASNQ